MYVKGTGVTRFLAKAMMKDERECVCGGGGGGVRDSLVSRIMVKDECLCVGGGGTCVADR